MNFLFINLKSILPAVIEFISIESMRMFNSFNLVAINIEKFPLAKFTFSDKVSHSEIFFSHSTQL